MRTGARCSTAATRRQRIFTACCADDCDLKGTSLTEFFRQRFVQALVCGSSYIVVDFPKVSGEARTRAEEDACGQSRAYLMDYGARGSHQLEPRPAGRAGLDRAAHFLPAAVEGDGREVGEGDAVDLLRPRELPDLPEGGGNRARSNWIDEGRHGLASLGRVPVFEMKVSEGLWLMNKSASLQLEHFNKSNALSWALTMGLFASPVVYSDREWKQVVGESYYIQLGKDDRFGWTEPEGKVYQIAADNLENLRDEIYRVCYLMIQAGEAGTGARQSAVSKQLDFATTEEVLRAYGDTVKEAMKQTLRAIAAARQDGVTIDVSGMDEFDINDLGTELDDAQKLLSLGIESKTLKKEVFKRLALKYLSDAGQDIKNKVAEEIEGGE